MLEPISWLPIIAGILLLVVGFGFHWIGQLISVLNWPLAERLGLQEASAPREYRVYEHGVAMADVALGWLYGVAGFGLLIGAAWAPKLAFLPGSILLYHSLSFWFWSRNQRRDGHPLMGAGTRVVWTLANALTAALTLWVAWNGA
jgi:hypothetical protein